MCAPSSCPDSHPLDSHLLLLDHSSCLSAALTPLGGSLLELWISIHATCRLLQMSLPRSKLFQIQLCLRHPLEDYYPSQTWCVWDWIPYFTLHICSIQRDLPAQLMATPFCQWLSPKILVSSKPPSQLENHTDAAFAFPKSDHWWHLHYPMPGGGIIRFTVLTIGCTLVSSTVYSQETTRRML